jgi:tetratricopeptide (TPR) repeat protein
MNKIVVLLSVCVLSGWACASWYWPFGGGDKSKEKIRISEMMEPASILIDEASDFAEDGKTSEAIDKYRKALEELDRIELENGDRAQSAAFATLRNKRAYVNAAIDSLLLKEAQQNARAVAVTDTTELEKKYARLKAGKSLSDGEKMAIAEKKVAEIEEQKAVDEAKPQVVKPQVVKLQEVDESKANAEDPAVRKKIREALEKDPKNRRAKILLAAEDLKARDFDAVLLTVKELLEERPNDAAALNMRAAVETEKGEFKKAERTLDQSIQSNPRSHYAYYNMARLFLRTRGAEGKEAARRYYETGRKVGGPKDEDLEAQF